MVNYECYIRWHAMRDYEALEEILVTARKKVPDPFKNSRVLPHTVLFGKVTAHVPGFSWRTWCEAIGHRQSVSRSAWVTFSFPHRLHFFISFTSYFITLSNSFCQKLVSENKMSAFLCCWPILREEFILDGNQVLVDVEHIGLVLKSAHLNVEIRILGRCVFE